MPIIYRNSDGKEVTCDKEQIELMLKSGNYSKEKPVSPAPKKAPVRKTVPSK